MVQLNEKNKDNSIPVSELKDGQIAVITEWGFEYHIGKVIQRSGGRIISVGGSDFWIVIPKGIDCRVRILSEGTELIITNNQ